MSHLPAESEWMANFYDRKMAAVVSRLRDLADQVERVGRPQEAPGFDETPVYADAAGRVIHALQWGMANLSIDGLITDAARVDHAIARALTEDAS